MSDPLLAISRLHRQRKTKFGTFVFAFGLGPDFAIFLQLFSHILLPTKYIYPLLFLF